MQTELGEQTTTLIISWGNRLSNLDKLQYMFYIYRDLILSSEAEFSKSNPVLPGFPTEILHWLQSAFQQYRMEVFAIDTAVDHVRESMGSSWENQAIAMYNYGTLPDEVQLNPYSVLFELVSLSKMRALLDIIRNQLSKEEFTTLEIWFHSQRIWKDRTIGHPRKLYSINELLDQN